MQLRQHKNLIVLILIAFALTIGLYIKFGSYQELKQYREALVNQEKQQAEIKQREALITKFKKYLKTHKKDAKAWYLHGKLLLANQKAKQAQQSLRKAYKLKPRNTQYTLAYVKASFFANGMQLKPAQRCLLQRLLKRNPKQVEALNMLGMDAFFHKRYKTALKIWNQELKLYPADSPQVQTLQRAIAQAKAQTQS